MWIFLKLTRQINQAPPTIYIRYVKDLKDYKIDTKQNMNTSSKRVNLMKTS